MFFAINSKTKHKVNSITVEQDPSYQFVHEDIWFADSDEIESCPKELDINSIKVIFREGSSAISCNGKKYVISPHFFIPNKSKLGINTIPESKEHKLAKNFIYNRIKDKNLKIAYSEISKPYKYTNEINLFDLPIDFQKVGIEVSASTMGRLYRRADIIIPFLVSHNLLGKGIVIEIQFSAQREKTKINRELDWAIRGYSVAWLWIDDFDQITDLLIDLKEDKIRVESFSNLIKINNKSFCKELKYTVQEEIRLLDSKLLEKKNEYEDLISKLRKEKYELELAKGFDVKSIDRILNDKIIQLRKGLQPTCPRCNILMIIKKGDRGQFWGCSNYPNCKTTMQVLHGN